MTDRLTFVDAHSRIAPETFAGVVTDGLRAPQKRLPCRYFYDSTGSHLFERICKLPEYYLTRTEQSILDSYAAEILECMPGAVSLTEFGSGSSCKTRTVIACILSRQPALNYTPIDISGAFLRSAAEELLTDYPRLSVHAVAAEYHEGIRMLPVSPDPRLVLFLGSNIGNFEPLEAVHFLRDVRSALRSEDRLLVGIDLVKEHAVIEAAYNDAAGVTAAFNKNLLVRINRELDADFDTHSFGHAAPWVDHCSRIEMRLVSARRQCVNLHALGESISFSPGEHIHTENSHKYTPEMFQRLAAEGGFDIEARWQDRLAWFALCLLRPRAGEQLGETWNA